MAGAPIGRLGALAVAVGIGTAVAGWLPATASAAPGETAAAPGKGSAVHPGRDAAGRAAAARKRGAPSASASVRAKASPAQPVSPRARTQTVSAVYTSSGSAPGDAPGQAAAAWSVLAWARRDTRRAVARGGTAAAQTTGQLTAPAMSPNLLINPGAEAGDPSLSGNSAVSVPGWTLTGTPTVIRYGTPRNAWPIGTSFAMPNLPSFMGFPGAGSGPGDTQFFGGGNVATSTLTQTVDLGEGFDAAGVAFALTGQLGGWLINPGAASVKVDFLDANRTYLGTASIGPVTLFDRFFQTGLKTRQSTGVLPDTTRYAQVTVRLQAWTPLLPGLNAAYNSAFADNLSFTVGADLPAPPDPAPPVSTVGRLDHVYMVYMENKGFDDIVGSPNAPFLNSLINAYGFAADYYGLTHPSLPNYYPMVGGTDFGLTHNCASPCIAAETTLVSNIDDAGLTWRSYAQSLQPGANPLVSSGDYAVDQTPFPAFESIGNDEAYARAHIVPLGQMAIDLQSTETAPNYAWFAANEDFNGEGPVDFPWGVLSFAISQITPGHQYNVPALDEFLSQTVPVVLNSAAWNTDTVDDTNRSVLVVTFDEDNNNTSLGFGNEGNHIVTVLIPNKDAIDAGMRAGGFTANNHYNHYSLLRMIEDSLGLPSLTNNDAYAAPMNEFWDGTAQGSRTSVV